MSFKKLDKQKLLKDRIDDLHEMTDEELKQWAKEYDFSIKKININEESGTMLTWEDLKNKDIAIRTPTEDLMKLVTNTIAKKYHDVTYEEHIKDEFNVGLSGGFCEYKENTCIELDEDKDEFDSFVYTWAYADNEFYLIEGYQMVEYDEVRHLFESNGEIHYD